MGLKEEEEKRKKKAAAEARARMNKGDVKRPPIKLNPKHPVNEAIRQRQKMLDDAFNAS